VPWVFVAVSLVGAALTVNAWVPVRSEPFTVASFALGWIPGELPVQVLAVEVMGTVVFAVYGAFASWPGWVGLGVALASWVGLVGLAVVGHRAGGLVDAALQEATGGPIRVEGFDPTPAWNYWWRLAIAVPFRWRSIRRIRNIDYWGDGIGRHRLDILERRGRPRRSCPVLVYIHGGAWVMGDKRQQGIPLMHELIERGWVCVAINYRLSPRATWPEHVIDCKRALAWVHEHIAEYGGDPSFVAVAGGSAGGHLAALVGLTPGDPEWQPGFEEATTTVDACLPFYGVHDMTGRADGSGEFGPGLMKMLEGRVMKVTQADHPEVFEQASPDRRITAAAPPMMVFQGVNDTLVPVGVARTFVDRLRATSTSPVVYVELPRTQHAFDVLASVRCRHTSIGAARFLECLRARGLAEAAAGPDRLPIAE